VKEFTQEVAIFFLLSIAFIFPLALNIRLKAIAMAQRNEGGIHAYLCCSCSFPSSKPGLGHYCVRQRADGSRPDSSQK